jgi:hypothetical protein
MLALWFQSRHNLVPGLFSVMRNIAIRHAISPRQYLILDLSSSVI